MKFNNGQYLIGEVKGVKTTIREGQNGQYNEYYLGVGFEMPNGYEGQEVVIDVKLTKDNIANRMHETLGKFATRRCAVPINVMSRSYKDKAYQTTFFDGRRHIVEIS
jgi:hypothetical protein